MNMYEIKEWICLIFAIIALLLDDREAIFMFVALGLFTNIQKRLDRIERKIK